MTDTRIPEQWLYDPRWLRLTPTVRADAIAWLVWSVAQRSDGVLAIADLELCTWRTDATSLPVLLDVGIVAQVDADHVAFVDFDGTQTSSTELAAADEMRRKARDRKRKSRAKKAQEDVTRDSHVTQQDRTGQDRQGQAYTQHADDVTTSWDVTPIPIEDELCIHGTTVTYPCKECFDGVAQPQGLRAIS